MGVRLAANLAVASIRTGLRRSLFQAGVASLITGSLLVAAATATSAASDIEGALDSSGALLFEIKAIGDDGSPESFSDITTEAIDELDNVTSSSQIAHISGAVRGPRGSVAASEVSVFGMSSGSRATLVGYDMTANPGALDFQMGAVVGADAALKLGVTSECATTGLCIVEVESESFPVVQIRQFEDPTFNSSIIIPIEVAVELGLSNGPTKALVGARALPVNETALRIDKAVSVGGQSIFVTEPQGSDLRAGFAKVWTKMVSSAAIGLMLLASLGQVAQHLATVGERRGEIATLRSLGVSPFTVVMQFILELSAPSFVGATAAFVGFGVAWSVSGHSGWPWGVSPGAALILSASTCVAAVSAAIFAAAKASSVAPSEVFDV